MPVTSSEIILDVGYRDSDKSQTNQELNMKFEIDSVCFKIRVDFPDCDVDAVFAELRVSTPVPGWLVGARRHEVATPKTPTAQSIDNCLNSLNNDEMEKLGVRVIETYGLMMGCCYFVCKVDADKYTPELSNEVVSIAKKVFSKRVRYHKKSLALAN